MKALEKTPADRFSSAAAFADALQSDEDLVPASTVPVSAQRNRNASRLPWTLTAVLAAGVVGLLWRERSPTTSGGGVTRSIPCSLRTETGLPSLRSRDSSRSCRSPPVP